jgi:hypothetical protein
MSTLIDKCVNYIEGKDCSYLAKEGTVVFFASDTGRKSDYSWKKQTITETLRIIKATKLNYKESAEIKDSHLITAFQELGRVYEYGIKSRYEVTEGIFNYSAHSEISMGDEIASSMLGELLKMEFYSIKLPDLVALQSKIHGKLKVEATANERRDLLIKHAEEMGFIIKTGSARPLVNGKLTPVAMQVGQKPKDVLGIGIQVANEVTDIVYRRLS